LSHGCDSGKLKLKGEEKEGERRKREEKSGESIIQLKSRMRPRSKNQEWMGSLN